MNASVFLSVEVQAGHTGVDEALAPRQDHAASLYWNMGWSWSPVRDPRHKTSLSSSGDREIPGITV